MVAFMAGPILRERVTAGRWLAVAMGFIGVLIACHPGLGASGPILLALGAAVLWSFCWGAADRVERVDHHFDGVAGSRGLTGA
jgi:drug/metabolite transporter (DMT)-like permease